MTSIMQQVRIEKVTLNVGVGKEQNKLEKAIKLLEKITNRKPVKTVTQKRIAGWGLRPGLPIGCKITLRKNIAKELLKRLLSANDNRLSEEQIDEKGNIAFGIPEYIDIPGAAYEPEIGMLGLQVCITLEKPGYRIKRRKIQKKKIGKKHIVTKEEAIEFLKKEFSVVVGE